MSLSLSLSSASRGGRGRGRGGVGSRKSPKFSDAQDASANGSSDPPSLPQSMIFHRGSVSPSLLQLVRDLRRVFSPNTAEKLKETKNNHLKDFLMVAPHFGVSHFIVLSQSLVNTNLRFIRVPHGPTITLRAAHYSLMKDVAHQQSRPHSPSIEYQYPPLIVLNNFNETAAKIALNLFLRRTESEARDENHFYVPEYFNDVSLGDYPYATTCPILPLRPLSYDHLRLLSTFFQNMVQTLHIEKLDLNHCRRVLLFNFNPYVANGSIEMRHYLIMASPVGLSRPIKKIIKGKVFDLNNLNDISELISRQEELSMSESEGEDAAESKVEMPQDLNPSYGKGNRESAKSAIRLKEIGPRLALLVHKIEEEFNGGRVLYHERIVKSREEEEETRKSKEFEKKEKVRRRREQEENVERKKRMKEEERKRSRERNRRGKGTQESEEEEEDGDNEVDEYEADRDYEYDPMYIKGGEKNNRKARSGEDSDDGDDGDNGGGDNDVDDDSYWMKAELGEIPKDDLETIVGKHQRNGKGKANESGNTKDNVNWREKRQSTSNSKSDNKRVRQQQSKQNTENEETLSSSSSLYANTLTFDDTPSSSQGRKTGRRGGATKKPWVRGRGGTRGGG